MPEARTSVLQLVHTDADTDTDTDTEEVREPDLAVAARMVADIAAALDSPDLPGYLAARGWHAATESGVSEDLGREVEHSRAWPSAADPVLLACVWDYPDAPPDRRAEARAGSLTYREISLCEWTESAAWITRRALELDRDLPAAIVAEIARIVYAARV